MKTNPPILCGILLCVLMLTGCENLPSPINQGNNSPGGFNGQVDDWQYTEESLGYGGAKGYPNFLPSSAPMMTESSAIGFSTGGAKDINNFRENIENKYLPLPTDITYEGLFYDYYFDTGEAGVCNKLFCPSYTSAITKDPFSENEEYYLAVGLNSGIQETDFKRKKLNVIIVLDISGSMDSSFDKYYYDQFGNKREFEEDRGKSKMEIAAESVVALLDHLDAEDRFGMVLFNDGAAVAKPLREVGTTDLQRIKDHVLEIGANGGTNMESGMETGTELFESLRRIDPTLYENRIIFITDAMPNLGETDKSGLLGMTNTNAENGIYTTFIGVGVDFNTELIEHLTKIRGANYYSVHSAKEFKDRMDEGFDYMVTPLVFNLQLNLHAEGYEIENVYGSPEADEATGEIMKVNTLFPSKTEAGETKGGLVLLKLRKIAPGGRIVLKVSYEDREGVPGSDEQLVAFPESRAEYFANTGIRKGILLARYADLMKNWMSDERKGAERQELIIPVVNHELGIIIPEPFVLGEWERQSLPLTVAKPYRELFAEFVKYFEAEMRAINDPTLEKELRILETLSTPT